MEEPAPTPGESRYQEEHTLRHRPAAHAQRPTHTQVPPTYTCVLFWEGGACTATPKGLRSQETEEKETSPVEEKRFLPGT